jgi:DNA-binding MarR family transcriptional regulator
MKIFLSYINRMDQIDAVLIALRKVIRATDLHSKYLAKNTGLTTAQLLILQSIQNMGEVSIGEISKKISLSQATVTSILDRLADKGLVYRERSTKDKRKVHAYLTEDAVALIKDAPAPLQKQFTKQFEALNEWEQSMMISSLQRIAQMMDAEDIDASPVLDVGILDRKNPN